LFATKCYNKHSYGLIQQERFKEMYEKNLDVWILLLWEEMDDIGGASSSQFCDLLPWRLGFVKLASLIPFPQKLSFSQVVP
jgi:hypothetical protein